MELKGRLTFFLFSRLMIASFYVFFNFLCKTENKVRLNDANRNNKCNTKCKTENKNANRNINMICKTMTKQDKLL